MALETELFIILAYKIKPMNPKLKTLFFFVIGAFAGILTMYLISNYKIEKRNQYNQEKSSTNTNSSSNADDLHNYRTPEKVKAQNSLDKTSIEEQTEDKKVIAYVKSNHQLPNFYITKSAAKKQGWIPSKGNLCDVLPGKAIGGDHFSNREKQLPKGGQYYEVDVNYNCGNRGADRIIFTKNGDVWLTKDHYRTFDQQ